MKLAERIFRRKDYYITSKFGWRTYWYNGKQVTDFHTGVDYGTYGEKWAQYALEDGYVLSCGKDSAYGNALFVWVVYPRLNIKLLHYHLDSISVYKGQEVNKDTILGYTGTTGYSTGIHLHLGMKYLNNNDYVDPEQYDYKEAPAIDFTGVITYQAVTKSWLPEVNKVDNTDDGYAGIGNELICGFRCKPQYGELIYEASLLNGDWLGAVNSKDYATGGDNSYAGWYGKPIDRIRIKSTLGWVKCRVKTREDGWLPWVDKFSDDYDGYAGIKGHAIIGIQMY